MIIDELSEYLQIKPMDCFNYFNIFLSHETKLVEAFFDPSSNEPCIEFFYEQNALSHDNTNISIRKDSSFIMNLRTNFMKDIYFHERNCIIASLRLLLILSMQSNNKYFYYVNLICVYLTTEEEKGDVINEVVNGLLKEKGQLETSLWDQYIQREEKSNLSAEDCEIFEIQKQFEQDQIIKVLSLIAQRGNSVISTDDYLKVFTSQNFKGVPISNESIQSLDIRVKSAELSTIIGDSCLMLLLIKIQDPNQTISENLLRCPKESQQMQVLTLAYSRMQSKPIQDLQHEQIEHLYKLVSRIFSYKNLGAMKEIWQSIFFQLVLKVLPIIYDKDQLQDDLTLDCLSRVLSKTICKNHNMIDRFWETLEQPQVVDQFKTCFKSSSALYKIMKNALGTSTHPKSDKVIVFLSNIPDFSFYDIFHNTQIFSKQFRGGQLRVLQNE